MSGTTGAKDAFGRRFLHDGPWAALGVLVSLALGAFSAYLAIRTTEILATNDARDARQSIVQNALQMSQMQATAGVGRQNEILLLAADSQQLIEEFGQKRLHLSPTLYRQIAQYVAWSTTDLDLAKKMAGAALQYSDDDSLERIHVHRVLGDVAAQQQQPLLLAQHYADALEQAKNLRDADPAIDSYTRAYRLIDAYLGARRADDEQTFAEFCKLASDWGGDRPVIEAMESRPLVRQAMQRALGLAVTAEPTTSDLVAVCD